MHATIAVFFESPDTHLRIDGELDVACQRPLRNHAADILDGSNGDLALDLAGVTFVDCAVLRTLDRLRRELVAVDRRFVITDASLAFGLVAYLAEYDELLGSVAGVDVTALRSGARRRPRPTTGRHGAGQGVAP